MTVQAPPVPPIWTTGSTEVFHTGTWRAARPLHVHAPSPCHQACPVGGDIAEWIGHARRHDFRAAWDVLTRHNPFPAISGRICHHPCEAACNRGTHDEALSICKLERFVGDQAIAQGWRFAPPAQERSGHVAVIGAGPAGLSAAFQLRRRGWRVTVYEASTEAGGLMRHGIPAYRLARDVLDAEIARIAELGVVIRCGEPLADAAQFERLRAAHDAVFVATGATRVKRLAALDYALPGVLDGAAYLAACNAGAAPALGRELVVIGGGSAALDAARSARRQGHAVRVLALESRAQMPAQREEVDEALEEGIVIVDGAMLVRLQAGADGLVLQCQRVNFVPGAVRGEFRIEPIAGSGFTLRADALLSCIGQDPELAPFGGTLAQRGALIDADPLTQASATERVWAGGDAASLARFVTEAIGMGKRAALDIHAALAGEAASAADEGPAVPLGSIATWYHEPAARAHAPVVPADERLRGSAEVQLGLEIEQALAEGARCFSCGTCITCDNCVAVCPDLAVRRVGDGYEVLAEYCKGCGLCVRECPTGSMTMIEERR
ncbi:MAG: FAD-dependent oxidoreductase [Ideonella sp.]|nr:FAD-dependent oxidoreductase [Ideonella sp.]MCC7459563.1 FAD-dependent oxidoreductase [Nitrospira sp.]